MLKVSRTGPSSVSDSYSASLAVNGTFQIGLDASYSLSSMFLRSLSFGNDSTSLSETAKKVNLGEKKWIQITHQPFQKQQNLVQLSYLVQGIHPVNIQKPSKIDISKWPFN